MSKLLRLSILALWSLALSLSSSALHGGHGAEQVEGYDDPAFKVARQLWLEGQTLEALHSLSTLSRDDNTAAQMFLSQLGAARHTHEQITQTLPREERILLLRKEKDISGVDWMGVAAANDTLAKVLWHVKSGTIEKPRYDVMIRYLLHSGEARAAFKTMLEAMANLQHEQILKGMAEAPGVLGLPVMHLFGHILADHDAKFPDAELEVNLGEQGFRQVNSEIAHLALEGPPSGDMRAAISLMQAPSMSPLLRQCLKTCRAAVESCFSSGVMAAGFAGLFPYPFESPSPTFVSNVEYWASERFRDDLRALLRQGGGLQCPAS